MAGREAPFVVTIERLPSPGMNPNRSQGKAWPEYHAAKMCDHEAAWGNARSQRLRPGMPWASVTAHVHFVIPYVKSPRRRDWDNLIASCKGFWDGLVGAGVLTDDSMDVIKEVSFSNEFLKGSYAETIFEIRRSHE